MYCALRFNINLNLDHPLEYGYSEILPLTRRIAAQKCQIREQEEELKRRKNEFEI